MSGSENRRPVVVVLGMHRSGTSLLANLLAEWGVELGDGLLPADEWNEAGYWEQEEIYRTQDEILDRLDRTWYEAPGLWPLPEGWTERSAVRPLIEHLEQLVRRELDRTTGLWGFKDPRTAPLLRMWKAIFDRVGVEPRYVLAVRHPEAVCASLGRRNQFPRAHAQVLWLRTYLDALRHVGPEILTVVDYDRWFHDADGQSLRLLRALGMQDRVDDDARKRAIESVVRADLRHHDDTGAPAVEAGDETGSFINETVDRVYDLLSRSAVEGQLAPGLVELAEASRGIDETLRCWSEAVRRWERWSPVAEPADPSMDAVTGDDAATTEIECLPEPPPDATLTPKRVCIVSSEFIGPYKNGGIGTACTTLGDALAKAGHEVTLLYARREFDSETPEHWIEHYRKQGIRFVPLPFDEAVRPAGSPAAFLPYFVYQWLKQNDEFDVIHFHEMYGIGYYVQLAQRQGLGFAGTTMVVGAHSSHEWLRHANSVYLDDAGDLDMEYLERRSVAMADVVWSPSRYMVEWMRSNGWELPERSHFRPLILPRAVRRVRLEDPPATRPVSEIVFFGRLETRKGLALFCDALDGLSGTRDFRVTFLGKYATVLGRPSKEYLDDRSKKWSFEWQVLSDLDQPEAVRFLQGEGRVSVIASPIDNSPNTVYESLGAGIPLLPCRAGGIPELIHPEDAERVCFPYDKVALAERLADVLDHGVAPSRPSIDFDDNERAWARWHGAVPSREERAGTQETSSVRESPLVSICIPHYNRPHYLRQALESVRAQDYPHYEVILVDDGSTTEEAQAYLRELEPEFERSGWKIVRQRNRYLGAARNEAARRARGEFLLFLDDDNYAMPHALRTYVRAALRTDADIVTCFMDPIFHEGRPDPNEPLPERWVFLGSAALSGIYRNVFGDAFALYRREAFESVGGFTEDKDVTHEDWEFHATAALRGLRIDVVPEALFWYRVRDDSMIRTTDDYRNNMRHVRPYRELLPDGMKDLVTLSQAQQKRRNDLIGAVHHRDVLLLHAIKLTIDAVRNLATPDRTKSSRELLAQAMMLAEVTAREHIVQETLLAVGAAEIQLGDTGRAHEIFSKARELAQRNGDEGAIDRAAKLLAALDRLSLAGEGTGVPAGVR